MKTTIPGNNQTFFARISGSFFLLMFQYFNRKALKHLQNDTTRVSKVQQKVLMQILNLQKETEYGKKYNFSAMQSVADFRKKHPLTTYEDYRPILEKIADTGDYNHLLAEPIILFQETAGTTGPTKLIPRTKRLFSTFQKAVQAVFEIIDAHYLKGKAPATHCRGLAFTNAQPLKLTPSGIPRGTGTSGGLKQSKFVQNLLRLKYTSPPSVILISDYKIAYYCHWLFGLLDSSVAYIAANFASNILQALQTLETMWPQLIQDIQSGQIDQTLALDKSIREELQSSFYPDPARAKALKYEFEKGFKGILSRIWPQLTYLQCVTTGSMQLYQQNLQFYAGDIPIYSPGYGASESWVGVNLEPDKQPPGYVITPHAAFFEFIPAGEMDADKPATLDLTALSLGESYEIVVTTAAGLYRYRLGDVVKCIGHYNQCPIIEFLYRRGSLLNFYYEKVTENTVFAALTEAIKMLGNDSQIVDYTTRMEFAQQPWQYVIYVEVAQTFETSPDLKQCRVKMEELIYEMNQTYLELRQANSIGPLELKLVKKGAFERFKNQIILQGASETQFKMPRLVKDSTLTDLLETMVLECRNDGS